MSASTPPDRWSDRTRRPRALRFRWVTAAALLASLAAIGFSTEYRSADDSARAAREQAFDPAKFGAQTYQDKVVPAIRAEAVDLPVLLAALAADKDAAGAEHGHRQGTGPYSFAVTGTGIAGAAKGSLLPVTVPGLPEGTRVSLQVGPAVNGTALRDAVGFITFGQFLNQVEYADAATALNDELRAKLLDGLDVPGLAGKRITFTGAFSFLTPTTVTITPVDLREAP